MVRDRGLLHRHHFLEVADANLALARRQDGQQLKPNGVGQHLEIGRRGLDLFRSQCRQRLAGTAPLAWFSE
jgi:hypothetical protein